MNKKRKVKNKMNKKINSKFKNKGNLLNINIKSYNKKIMMGIQKREKSFDEEKRSLNIQ